MKSFLLLLAVYCLVFTVALSAQSIGDFRSHQSGNWSDVNTWEYYDSTSTWVYPALHFPTSTDSTITILPAHTVMLDTSIAIDQAVVNGTLTVSDTAKMLTIVNGAGTDLTINGTFNAGRFTSAASATILVAANGVLNNQLNSNAVNAGSGAMTVNGIFKMSGYTANGQLAFTNVTFAGGASGGTLYIGGTGIPRLPGASAGNVIWNTGAAAGNTIITTTATTIGGNFTIIATGDTINLGSGGTLRGLTVSGDMIIQGGTFVITKTPGSKANTLTVNGNLVMTGGTLLTSSSKTSGGSGVLTVKGNILNTGGVLGRAPGAILSTVTLGGTSAQLFAAAGLINKQTFTINNSAGVTLASDVILDTVLTVTSGKVTLGNYNLTLSGLTGASSTNYFITNGTGSLRSLVGAAAIVFPVGSSTSYNPATITNAGTADTFAVRVKSSFDDVPADTTIAVARQWTISETAPGAANAAIALQWNAADAGSAFSPASSVLVSRDVNGGWVQTSSAAVSGTNPYTASVSGLSSFGNFAVGNANAVVVSVPSMNAGKPEKFALDNNYPNPFNPSTTIRYALPERSTVTIKVYSLLGQEIATLANTEQEAGYHNVVWNGHSASGSQVASGMYFYEIQAGSFSAIKRMVMLK